jgi:hypothetical protein
LYSEKTNISLLRLITCGYGCSEHEIFELHLFNHALNEGLPYNDYSKITKIITHNEIKNSWSRALLEENGHWLVKKFHTFYGI